MCKGDIFLNPALKEGRDILREYYHDDHIIHAIKYFSRYDGYGELYCDLKAGFGAISTEVVGHFKNNQLYEADEILVQILRINMSLKNESGKNASSGWEIISERNYPEVKSVVRCETVADLRGLLATERPVIIFQNRKDEPIGGDIWSEISRAGHVGYVYSADLNKKRPLKTTWTLLTKGYAFKMTQLTPDDRLDKGDYIFLPKNL